MFEELFQQLRNLVHLVPDVGLARPMVREAIVVVLCLALVGLLEWSQRRDLTHYRTRGFANDLVYSFFYQGGVYSLLVYVPLFGAMQEHLGFAKLGLLHDLPLPVAFVAYWLIADFLNYWLHRAFHSWAPLWAFHSVHHAPKQMTFLTSNRNHIVEQMLINAAMLLPIVVMGAPKAVWVPMLVLMSVGESLQHARLDWRYGPLYRVFVSPMFHNLHHSTRPEEYNGNYGKILSVWDFVFGTGIDRDRLPEHYGLVDSPLDENLRTQLLHPFRVLASGAMPSPSRPSQGLHESP